MFEIIREDIQSFMERDPAARSRLEIVFLYPGFHAVLIHRVAHAVWRCGFRWFARFLSQMGRFFTAIEIHPGARIGRRFVIDHGSGVVIGETAEIGADVTLYHDVTLGGIAPSIDSSSQVDQKRHPTLEDGVIIGSGAQILGPITVGKGARVGANAVALKDVPTGVTVVGIPARVVVPRSAAKGKEFAAYGAPNGDAPDPVDRSIDGLLTRVGELTSRVEELERRLRERSKSLPHVGLENGDRDENMVKGEAQ